MFVAIVPPDDLVEELAAFVESRRDADQNLRWTEPFQWHLTLGFLGDVLDRKRDELIERLDRAAARRAPFSLRVTGSGAFPSAAYGKVIWLGLAADPRVELDRLAAGVRRAAAKAGIEIGGGRFRPHVTMARVRRPVDVSRWLRVLGAYKSATWTASEIQLIQSHLGNGRGGKPRYEQIGSFALRVVPDRDALSDTI